MLGLGSMRPCSAHACAMHVVASTALPVCEESARGAVWRCCVLTPTAGRQEQDRQKAGRREEMPWLEASHTDPAILAMAVPPPTTRSPAPARTPTPMFSCQRSAVARGWRLTHRHVPAAGRTRGGRAQPPGSVERGHTPCVPARPQAIGPFNNSRREYYVPARAEHTPTLQSFLPSILTAANISLRANPGRGPVRAGQSTVAYYSYIYRYIQQQRASSTYTTYTILYYCVSVTFVPAF